MGQETNHLPIYQPNPTIGDIKTKPNLDPFCLFPKDFSFQILNIFHIHNKIIKIEGGNAIANASRRKRIKGSPTIRTRCPLFTTTCCYPSHWRGIFK
ncbi:hypothetical protein M9H77_17053 [Catharanthus roseus]|uniref:Uncharacterized protein n=1 Tax=Catharanthus roseus TaxID=4058 RepID=A0ACC0B3I1_CATRO|nr:hypothetical protein M9H77_17053 [Catharanthus roseus]